MTNFNIFFFHSLSLSLSTTSFSSWIRIEIMRIIYRFCVKQTRLCTLFILIVYDLSLAFSVFGIGRTHIFLQRFYFHHLRSEKCIFRMRSFVRSPASNRKILVHCTLHIWQCVWVTAIRLWIDAILTIHLLRNWIRVRLVPAHCMQYAFSSFAHDSLALSHARSLLAFKGIHLFE